MRPPRRDPVRDPRPRHSIPRTLLGAAAATSLLPVLVLAILYPVAALGLAALAVAAGLALGPLRRFYRARKRQGRTREVCIPRTGVCIEV